MRSLTTSDGQLPRWLVHFSRQSSLLSLLLYLFGLVYLSVIIWPAFNDRTYFSENALLPGLVDEQFDQRKMTNDFARQLNRFRLRTNTVPYRWFLEQFAAVGLETTSQNFSFILPGMSKEVTGTNIYGIIRAARAPSIESIVLVVPYKNNSLHAISLILSLASFCREQSYWAKDLIFVVVERETVGMQAWLSEYHGKSLPILSSTPLSLHAGSIQAAIVLDVIDNSAPFTHMDVRYNMVNGQLPNLDLVNLMIRLADRHELVSTIFMREDPRHHHLLYTQRGYWQMFGTSYSGLLTQAFTADNGLHSVFGAYGLQAVTIVPYSLKQHGGGGRSRIGWVDIGRLLEGSLRSVNNLLEQFHQSFFFYFLPHTHRYVSIGIFMPVIGLLVSPVLIKALFIWLDMNENSPKIDSGKEDDKLQNSGSVFAVISSIVFSHLCGYSLYALPSLLFFLKSPISTDSQKLFIAISSSSLALIAFPWTLKKTPFNKHVYKWEQQLLRMLALFEFGLITGILAVLNFGLALFLAIISVPVLAITVPRPWNSPMGVANFVLLLSIHPLIFCFLVYLISSNFLPSISMNKTSDLIVNLIGDSFIYESYLYGLGTIALLPVWLTFWSLVHQIPVD